MNTYSADAAAASTNNADGISRTIPCRLCGKPIKFDERRVSHRTGTKIPLEPDTDEPHKCPMQPNPYQQKQQSQPQHKK
jgi:hypothetical protein